MGKLNRFHKIAGYFFLFLIANFPVLVHAQLQIGDQSTITSCQYIDEVEGASGYGKKIDWRVFAQYSALKKAEKLGASHVVWDRYYPVGAFNGIAVAKVYRCNT